MAIVSFARIVSVNSDWGIRNLEYAVSNSKDLSSMYGEYRQYRKASKADIRTFAEEYGKRRDKSR
jgi:hypothetical protein